MLLSACLGIVGHWKQDFDTGAYLSGIYLYVTNDPFRYFALYPITPFAVPAQAIQDRKQRLVIGADFTPICTWRTYRRLVLVL